MENGLIALKLTDENGVEEISWEMVKNALQTAKGLEYTILPSTTYPGVEVGGVFSGNPEQEENKYSAELEIKALGTLYLFKLNGNTPTGFSAKEALRLRNYIEPGHLLNLVEDGYVLLSPTARELLVLPTHIELNSYREYYLEDPLPLQLKKLSKNLGFQVTMWVGQGALEKVKGMYNQYASDLLSHEVSMPVKIHGESILSTRTMVGELIAKDGYFSLALLEELALELTNVTAFPLEKSISLEGYLETLKEVEE